MLLRREAVRALAGVEGRLLHPVPDRLGRGLKLAPELLGRSAMPDQLDHLPPERRPVRPMALRHRGRSFPPQPWGVHETGSTPAGTVGDDNINVRHRGIVTFAGGQPVYQCAAPHHLLGAVGVSGDGVDEDDTVAKGAITGAGCYLTP